MSPTPTPRQKSALTALFVHKTRRVGKHYDNRGHGLYLCVSDTGSKRWEQRITLDTRCRYLGLGRYPDVSLREARKRALCNRQLVDDGIDPYVHKHSHGHRIVPTFAEAVEHVIQLRQSKWTGEKTEQRWRRALELYVFPKLGTFRVCDIETHHVATVLEAVAKRAPTSVSQVRQQIAAVTAWAVGQGYRQYDPCGSALDAVTPDISTKVEHHRALPYAEVSSALASVRASDAWIGTRLFFEFLVLTAVRTNEVRGARWSEIDFAQATWSVPALRMKEREAHSVPLSSAALMVLREARDHADLAGVRRTSADPDLVFLTMRGRVFYNNALSKLLTKLQIAADPHGFRSSFSVWAAETRVDFDIAEICLAHAVGSRVSRDYRRTDLYDARTRVMEDWARFAAPARSDPHLEPVAVPAADRTSVAHRVFSSNVDGRDFVVGDVHGCFRTLERALDTLGFDPVRDRLFGVGDLVNRGPHSADALAWLETRFAAVALGNHDRSVLRWFEGRRGTAAPTDSQWLEALPAVDHRRWRDALAAMPVAISIATAHGTVGIVHADVPHRNWSQATSMFESGDASALDVALLGLDAAPEAILRHQAQSVKSLTALVHGHDAGKTVRRSANRWNIDTGAGLRRLNRLTVLHVNASRIRRSMFDVDEGVADSVFPPGFRRPPRTVAVPA